MLMLMSVLSAALTASAQKLDNVADEIIWIVGDEAILKSDVEAARIEAMQQGTRLEGDPYCYIPEQLAIQKLFLHQADIDSVTVSDADVYQSVDNKIEYAIQMLNGQDRLEETFGKSVNQIRNMWYKNTREEMLMSKVRASLMEGTKVTPAQVRRYFKDMPEDSLPFIPTLVECQIVVREPVIEQTEIDRVKDELRGYTERVNSGQDKFATLARLYSQDNGTARRGGECGMSSRGTFVKEFSDAAFSLTDPNTVSKIVETEFGFHIIQLIEKRGEKVNVRHILRKPKVSDEALTKEINALDTISDEIRRGLYTFDYCAQNYSQDKDSRNNYGIMMNKNMDSDRYGTTHFEMKDLAPEVAREISQLKIGEISKPFIMVNEKGKEVVAIVRLKDQIKGHRATISEDYQALQDVLMAKLNQEKVEKWIREKQASTYIRINENWMNCEFQYPGWIKQ